MDFGKFISTERARPYCTPSLLTQATGAPHERH